MGLLDDSGAGSGERTWNYSDQAKPEFSQQLVGTIVKMEEVQSINFNTHAPDWWEDGKPKIDLKLTLVDQTGELITWLLFGGRSHLGYQGLKTLAAGQPITSLLGMMISAQTYQPKAGGKRDFQVQLLGPGQAPVIGSFPYTGPLQKPAIVPQYPQQQYPQPQYPQQQYPQQQYPQPMQQVPQQQYPQQVPQQQYPQQVPQQQYPQQVPQQQYQQPMQQVPQTPHEQAYQQLQQQQAPAPGFGPAPVDPVPYADSDIPF